MRKTTIGQRYGLQIISLLLTIILLTTTSLFIGTGEVYALGVPKITIDPGCLTPASADTVKVTGTISQPKGQPIVLYAKDGETELNRVTAGIDKNNKAFQLSVPASYVKANIDSSKNLKVYVQSLAVKGTAASKKVEATISCRNFQKSQSIKGAKNMTLTNLKTTAKIGAKASSGLKVTYSSNKPKVVSVNSSGKITRKKNGKVKITIKQAGSSKYLPVKKTITITSRKSTKQEQIDGAVAWAKKIAKDNSFTYGSGQGAHHFGCYFCGTNYGPNKYMKPSSRYKKTYCCNPFVSAAYAHGAQHPKMLAACRRASGIAMTKETFYRYGCWKCVGKPSYNKLQKGDVLVNSYHVAMYAGSGKLVEASGGNWSADSIAVRKMSSSRYNGFTYVMRYTGY